MIAINLQEYFNKRMQVKNKLLVPEQDNINNISTVAIIVNNDGSIRKAQHYNIVCKVIDQLLYIPDQVAHGVHAQHRLDRHHCPQRRELAALRIFMGRWWAEV